MFGDKLIILRICNIFVYRFVTVLLIISSSLLLSLSQNNNYNCPASCVDNNQTQVGLTLTININNLWFLSAIWQHHCIGENETTQIICCITNNTPGFWEIYVLNNDSGLVKMPNHIMITGVTGVHGLHTAWADVNYNVSFETWCSFKLNTSSVCHRHWYDVRNDCEGIL